MKPDILLTIRGTQRYADQEPETIELTTEAELRHEGGVLFLRYPESALTGLEGTVTTFVLHPHRVLLKRTGSISNEMEFEVGKVHQSLYDTGHGALLVTVRTTAIEDEMTLDGGSLRVAYDISIEGLGMGTIEYLLHARRLSPRQPNKKELSV